MPTPISYFKKQIRSFGYAIKGLKLMWKDHNTWVHVPAAFIVVGLGYGFGVSRNEWLWLIIAIALMWIGETFNTAIEKLVDLVSPNHHELAGKVKDIAAGGVLLCLFFSLLIGSLVFFPYLFNLLYGK
ncbi:MAG: diacylglycerol kinase [Flammeovirgaceae bacterium]|jgi:diacylglycerol kinase (ATP)